MNLARLDLKPVVALLMPHGVISDFPATHLYDEPGTRRVALVQGRLARLLAPLSAVRVVEPPYEAVPVRDVVLVRETVPQREALWWHPAHTHASAPHPAARDGRTRRGTTRRTDEE
ncbi:hypothetical protein BM536_028810 [Streptomyces phaeoluteigriseus]|uniref:Uncharacterized protein n=1 Tax=Streptomyces phaeoluteigriseus TaxID=114686 RepID=A0A1V6MLW6_9ACTN|nr:hypothetical protein BM536_028810 [Streptomyces phaeoluteigriseus]